MNHKSKEGWDYLTDNGRISIKQLDPITKKNVIDMLSQPYKSERDETDASENQKNIRKILSGCGYSGDDSSMSFDNNDPTELLRALYRPRIAKFWKSLGLSPKQTSNKILKKTLQIADERTGTTDNVIVVAIDGMPYFCNLKGWMYDNCTTRNILNWTVEKNDALLLKVIKKLLEDLGISSISNVVEVVAFKKADEFLSKLQEQFERIKDNNRASKKQDLEQFNTDVKCLKNMIWWAGYPEKELDSMSLDNILKIDVNNQEFKTRLIELIRKRELNKIRNREILGIDIAKTNKFGYGADLSEEEKRSLISFFNDCGFKTNKVSDIDTEDSDFDEVLDEYAEFKFVLNFNKDIFDINQKSDVDLIDLMSSKFSSSEQNQQYDEAQ